MSCFRSCFTPNSSALNIQPNMCLPSGTGDRIPPSCAARNCEQIQPGCRLLREHETATEEGLGLEAGESPLPGCDKHLLHRHSIQPCQTAARPHLGACRCTASLPAAPHSQHSWWYCRHSQNWRELEFCRDTESGGYGWHTQLQKPTMGWGNVPVGVHGIVKTMCRGTCSFSATAARHGESGAPNDRGYADRHKVCSYYTKKSLP